VDVHDAEGLKAWKRKIAAQVKESVPARGMREMGTNGTMDLSMMIGDVPLKNYEVGEALDLAASIQRVLEEIVLRSARHLHATTGARRLCLAGGVAPIAIGAVLEIHAQFNAAGNAGKGSYVATRIENATGATSYKLRGLVANLKTGAKTFELGGLLIDYSKVLPADLPQNLADGLRVRVRLDPAHIAGTPWVATSVSTGVRKVEDHEGADVRGAITAVNSATEFEINGLKVNTATAAFPDGSTGLVVGAMVEVEGAIVGGVLVATKVELESKHMMERRVFELHGLASDVDAAAKTFKLRGVTVSFAAGVTWKGVTDADLSGKQVEVKGTLSADRTKLQAMSIKLDS